MIIFVVLFYFILFIAMSFGPLLANNEKPQVEKTQVKNPPSSRNQG
jgi:hypothetical protein